MSKADAAAVLQLESVTMNFGGVCAVNRFSLEVRAGEIVALIGPNGAGKTTLFNCITGVYAPSAGAIYISPPGTKQPRRIDGLKMNEITAAGLARTFQNIRLFKEMTVLENVMIGRHCRTRAGILYALLRGAATRAEERATVDKSYAILAELGLAEQAGVLAKNLPYGAQRRLEIARALATDPFLLLLDEPAAGLNPQETDELNRLIAAIRRERGVSILLIEHDMRLVMAISERIFVMDYGERIAAGTPEEIRRDRRVIEAYLGEDE